MNDQNDNTIDRNRSLDLCRRIVTTESFIAEAKEVYGDLYDYSKVDYKNRDHRVVVNCPVHGDFQVFAREHLDGKGCPKCEKGEKFIEKLQEKFGDKFGLEQFVYESSTSPVTLVCREHGPFSRMPHQILNSTYGCPECANKVREESHQATVARKEEEREAKRRIQEEYDRQRLEQLLDERKIKKEKRERAIQLFLSGGKSYDFYTAALIYLQIVDEHIDDIKYNAKWREPLVAPYRLNEDAAKKLKCYREGDKFYRYPGEAPDKDFIDSFARDNSYYSGTFEDYLSHRNCLVCFDGNDLIIQEESYEHQQVIFPGLTVRRKTEIISEIPDSFVSIDFEHFYPQKFTTCSVGMVKYVDGKIVDTYYSLIRPPFDYAGKRDKALTWVHKFKKEDLIDQRTFDEVLPEIENFAAGLPLVAYNASTERLCIKDTCAYYNLDTTLDTDNILDVFPLAEKVEHKMNIYIKGPGTHELSVVCKRFNIPSENHHHALADSEMAGNLLLRFKEILCAIETKDMGCIIESVNLDSSPSKHKLKYNPEDKIQRTDLDSVQDNPFKNHVVVLTGFSTNDSQDYGHALKELGAIVREAVNRKTNILITGYNAGPSKLQKAQELGVRIMTEEELKEILSSL